MGSTRTLLTLTVIAAALAVALVVDRAGRRGLVALDTRIVPELRVGQLHSLTWAGGGDTVRLERADGDWRLTAPVLAPADPAAVERVVATLEFLRFQRRSDAAPARAGLRSLTVEVDGRAIRLGLPADQNQPWLARDDGWFLIRGPTARLLNPGLGDLRDRRPVAFEVEEVTGIDIARGPQLAVVSGPPYEVHVDGAPGAVRADDRAVARALEAVARLRLVSFADRPPVGDPELRLRIRAGGADQVLEVFGACPAGGRWVRGSSSTGCASAAAVAALDEALGRSPGSADGPATSVGDHLADRRPLVADPDRVQEVRVVAGARETRLSRRGATWNLLLPGDAGPVDAEAKTVERVLAALVQPGTSLVPLGADLRERLRLLIDGVGLRLYEDDQGETYWRRGEEQVVIAADCPGELIDPRTFRSLQIFDVEPTRARAIERRGRWRSLGPDRAQRGALDSDWTRPDGTAADPDALRAVRDRLARLRALRFEPDAPFAPDVTLVLTLDPTPGLSEPSQLRLELDVPGREGECRARVTGLPVFVVACGPDRFAW